MTSDFITKITKVKTALEAIFVKKADRSHISYGQVDSTSTSTAFTATVTGLTSLTDGATVMLRNGYITSAEGFTLDVNGLGAKPVYNSMADATRDTTIFNINYTMLFVYDSTRVEGGCWICYRGYNSDKDTNTIGYQLRTNSTIFTTADKGYRYRLWLECEDGKVMPVNTSTSTNATAKRDTAMNTRDFYLGGRIFYYSTKADTNANTGLTATTMWQQYLVTLGYSFNNTGAALVLTLNTPVYMVAENRGNGMGRLTSPYYTQTLPNTADNKLYIYLGHAISETQIELSLQHPIYEYKNSSIRLFCDTYTSSETDTLLNGKSDTGHTHTVSNITDFPSSITPSSHTHGNLQNDGSVGTSGNASKNVVTDSNGKITTEDKYTHPTELSSALSTKSLYKIKANTKGHITEATSIGIDTTRGGTQSSTDLITSDAVYMGLYEKADSSDVPSDINDLSDNYNIIPTDINDLSDNDNIIPHDITDLTDNDNVLVDLAYQSDIPTVPTKTSDLTNDADGTSGATYILSTDSRLSDARTPTTHTHGNLQNNGQVGSSATNNGIVLTDSSGKITASTSIAKQTIALGTSSNASKNVVTDANGKLTTEDKYSHPTPSGLGGAKTSGLYKVAIDAQGHITGTTSVGIDATSGGTAYSTDLITSGAVYDALSQKADSSNIPSDISDLSDSNNVLVDLVYSSDLGAVATSNDYEDLDNLPTIPTDVSDLTDTDTIIPTDVSNLSDNYDTPFTPKSHTHNNYVTSIALVPKSSNATGAITLYYGDEPS